ncbi:MAG: phosphotransferase enzyme family protein [Gammaproteobacteria bacterium]
MDLDLAPIAACFSLAGRLTEAEACRGGHINDSYVIRCGDVRYLLQRINRRVFKDPARVMDNIRRVTEHLQREHRRLRLADAERRSLRLVPTLRGAPYHRDESGGYWRIYRYIEGAVCHQTIESEAQAFQVARAFGTFQAMLTGLPQACLHRTIPDFHDLQQRLAAFDLSRAQDPWARAAHAQAEIEALLGHRALVDAFTQLRGAGGLPERVCHYDTKPGNVLFDAVSSEALCVIDLDTVMPGLALFDFGDLVRSAACPAPEDTTDLARVVMLEGRFQALLTAYLEGMGRFLTRGELGHLALAPRLVTCELALRFLTDYLMGDVYFRTERPAHNLHRCRVQLKLLESMERQAGSMRSSVAKEAAIRRLAL